MNFGWKETRLAIDVLDKLVAAGICELRKPGEAWVALDIIAVALASRVADEQQQCTDEALLEKLEVES